MFTTLKFKLTSYFYRFVDFCKSLPKKIKDFVIVSYEFLKKLLNQIIETIKLHKVFIIFFLYVFITLTYCPYLDNIFQKKVVNDPFFFVYITLFGFFVKMYMYVRNFKIRFSLFPNLYNLNLKFFSFIYSSTKISFLKFFIFLRNVIFLKSFSFFKNFLNFIFTSFKTWNPLFKKTSYFSWYKSFISRFLK